jgi:anti-sigma factor RsiW
MTDSDSNLNDLTATDEVLVAYLDGELDAEQRRSVEDRLPRDDDFRRRLNELDRAWDLLDELPKTVADESFVRSTVAMVAVAAEQEVSHTQRQSVWPRRICYAAVGALVVFAAVLGYCAVGQYADAENRALARDLPVIEDLDLYRRIDFLRQLSDEGLFDEEQDSKQDSAKDGGQKNAS